MWRQWKVLTSTQGGAPHFWVGPEPQPPIDISTIKINSLVVNQLSQLWDITLLEYWQDKLIRGDEESGTSIVKDDEGRYTPCPIKPSVKTEASTHQCAVNADAVLAFDCMLLRSRGVFFLSTIVQQEGAHRLRNNLQNCTSRLLSTRALWRAVCPCLLRRLRQMDVVYRLPKGCPWSSSRGVKSCWFVWFYWFLFQAVEVLCASPTSLQKFCPLKAGIQQHGNTFAS